MTPDEVHVWCARADGTDFRPILSPDELARADRYRMDRDRDRFIWCRGLLRTILGEQLRRPPKAISFCYGPSGKPYLPGTELRFNLSHSQDAALIALAWERELGVDIEAIRADVAASGIAERFFSPGERQALSALSPEHRVRAFFNCWTRKEAYMKARGDGFSLPLDRFEVTVAPDLRPALLKAPEGPAEVARWYLHDLSTPPGYAAALAVESGHGELRVLENTL